MEMDNFVTKAGALCEQLANETMGPIDVHPMLGKLFT